MLLLLFDKDIYIYISLDKFVVFMKLGTLSTYQIFTFRLCFYLSEFTNAHGKSAAYYCLLHILMD